MKIIVFTGLEKSYNEPVSDRKLFFPPQNNLSPVLKMCIDVILCKL